MTVEHQPARVPRYRVATDAQLKKAFPKDVTPPPLLFDFAAWLRGKPWGSIGAFELTARDPIDKLLPPEASESNHFAMFVGMPDGGLAGLWLKDTRDATRAPFVHMDSEGRFAVMAPNLALFLRRLSRARFDDDDPGFDFAPREDCGPALTAALASWLASHETARSVIARATAAERAYKDDGRAQRWLEALCRRIEKAKAADPHLAAIAAAALRLRLRPRQKPGFEHYRVFAAGSTMVIRRGALLTLQPRVERWLKPLPPAAEEGMRAPLFAAREAFAQGAKGRGLWPSATLVVSDQGSVSLDPNYDHEFAIGFELFEPTAFAADHARWPRDAAKLADWHRALIKRGKVST